MDDRTNLLPLLGITASASIDHIRLCVPYRHGAACRLRVRLPLIFASGDGIGGKWTGRLGSLPATHLETSHMHPRISTLPLQRLLVARTAPRASVCAHAAPARISAAAHRAGVPRALRVKSSSGISISGIKTVALRRDKTHLRIFSRFASRGACSARVS